MFQGIDVSIDWASKFLSNGGVSGIISAVALIAMAIRMKNLEKISIVLIQHERTTEENTDAQIATARELKALRHKISRISAKFEHMEDKDNGESDPFAKL